MQMLYLNRKDIEKLNISIGEVIDAVETSITLKGKGKIELPPKPGIHPRKDTFIHAMPACIGEPLDLAGMKWVSGYPENLKKDLPYIQGLIILNNPSDGTPIAVMDCTWVTEYRTAAASAVAAKYLAPENSEILTIIGLGVQGRIHFPALKHVLPNLKEVRLYDVNREMEKKFITDMTPLAGNIELKIKKDVKSAVTDADVIVTCTPILDIPHRFIPSSWLKEKSFSISVDYDSAFCEDVMTGAEIFVVDDNNQYLWTKEKGVYFRGYPSETFADMGEICAGKKTAEEGMWKRSAVLMGIACHDMVTADIIYKKAVEMKMGMGLEI